LQTPEASGAIREGLPTVGLWLLWFALDYEAQKRTDFLYKFSRLSGRSTALLFKRGRQPDNVYQHIINFNKRKNRCPILKTLLEERPVRT